MAQQIEDMRNTVAKQELAMLHKLQDMEEKGSRDEEKELMERKMREIYQLKKSDAIIKFELILSKMVPNSIKRSTVKTLHEVRRPIYNKQYGEMID